MLRRNLVANYIGQAWTGLMGIAFVPLYIRYLGIEAYGVIGLFVVLQAWLTLLDMGLTPTLGREMARLGAGAHTPESIRDLLRSVEWLAGVIALLIGIGIWAASAWLARDWVRADQLSPQAVERAFLAMGWVIALHFVEGIYRSAIAGLQRQVLLNAVSAGMATLRAVGAVAVLAWVSPTAEAYFVWQAVASAAAIATLSIATYRLLPAPARPGRFSLASLRGVWKFAGGMLAITLLSLLLTQVDKVLLSRLLTLADYGHYALAAAVAAVVFMGIVPIVATWFPRLCELHERGEQAALADAYHHACQLVAVVGGSMALVIAFFSHDLLLAWTRDAGLASRAAPLVTLLVMGNLLNCLVAMPYQAQMAHGWTSLTIAINLFAVAVIVPALLQVTPTWGAQGAAWVWIGVNAMYVFGTVHLMYRRILRGEKWRWYLQDILLPLAPAAAVAAALKYLLPAGAGPFMTLAFMAAAAVLTLAAAVAGSSFTRSAVLHVLRPSAAPSANFHNA